MWRNEPPAGVANGEPTYEHTGSRGHAEGWWQGHEAWSNLCAGGTMGVFYGAASLWQWRLHPEEPGHSEYFIGDGAGWREALDFEGSRNVGLAGKIMKSLPFLDMAPDWCRAVSSRGLSVPGQLLVIYREHGGVLRLVDEALPPHVTVLDPRTVKVVERLEIANGVSLVDHRGATHASASSRVSPVAYP